MSSAKLIVEKKKIKIELELTSEELDKLTDVLSDLPTGDLLDDLFGDLLEIQDKVMEQED